MSIFPSFEKPLPQQISIQVIVRTKEGGKKAKLLIAAQLGRIFVQLLSVPNKTGCSKKFGSHFCGPRSRADEGPGGEGEPAQTGVARDAGCGLLVAVKIRTNDFKTMDSGHQANFGKTVCFPKLGFAICPAKRIPIWAPSNTKRNRERNQYGSVMDL